MRNLIVTAGFFSLLIAQVHLSADEPHSHPLPLVKVRAATEPGTTESLVSSPDLFRDFATRLKAAIETRDFQAIMRLYQTNGTSAEALNLELAQWRKTLAEDTNATVSLWGKDLRRLPPEAQKFWCDVAERLICSRCASTSVGLNWSADLQAWREVTHLLFVYFGNGTGARLTLPLQVVENRMLLVSPDKPNEGPGTSSPPFNILEH